MESWGNIEKQMKKLQELIDMNPIETLERNIMNIQKYAYNPTPSDFNEEAEQIFLEGEVDEVQNQEFRWGEEKELNEE